MFPLTGQRIAEHRIDAGGSASEGLVAVRTVRAVLHLLRVGERAQSTLIRTKSPTRLRRCRRREDGRREGKKKGETDYHVFSLCR